MTDLTKGQRRYLSRRVCARCDIRMDYAAHFCGSLFVEKCSDKERAARQKSCLAEYKPRKPKT